MIFSRYRDQVDDLWKYTYTISDLNLCLVFLHHAVRRRTISHQTLDEEIGNATPQNKMRQLMLLLLQGGESLIIDGGWDYILAA